VQFDHDQQKPEQESLWRKEEIMKEKVESALDKIRPMLKADGGDVELVEITPDGVVKVKLTGACGGCPMSQLTLKMSIEKVLKQEIPEIKEVAAV
jgi:Fe-S cluster biogenesis protein NfuA